MVTLIIDCYTDEPAGLGVPPYLGTYPRYLAGHLREQGEDSIYLTIDDLRLWRYYGGKIKDPKPHESTNIRVYNLTHQDVPALLAIADRIVVNLGVHTPGKYLSAIPGTLHEINEILKDVDAEKILTGPAFFGTALEGGKIAEREDLSQFKEVKLMKFSFDEIKRLSIAGASVLGQIPDMRIIEIETARGCSRAIGCAFCTEPIKSKFEYREAKDVISEVKAFYDLGARYFRLGKQACFYSYPHCQEVLKGIRDACPDIEVLHIDNVDPVMVNTSRGERITQDIVKYCTEGNIAAFGVESFDQAVIDANHLNTTPERTYNAIKIINKYGADRGPNGLPKFLPGINILFGLKDESRRTHELNMQWLQKILDDNLMLRRINIRQVNVFPGTKLAEMGGIKFLKRNKSYYFRWRRDIREKIDMPNFKRVVPIGHILKDIYTETYDGKLTFGRHIGSYPIIVGIPGRLLLKKLVDVKVTAHMLRSITAEAISQPRDIKLHEYTPLEVSLASS
ncbi:radical SAM protein [Candidatus Woesearchaeota archaeon]|nr:radical SAM protein [Candidatus Woesearchaeota archaeon]